MDISVIDLIFFSSSHCHFAIIHPHVTHCSFMLFDLVVSENKFSLICLTFTGTLNQLHFTLLFIFTSYRTISYFSSSSDCFLWSMHACLLAVCLPDTRRPAAGPAASGPGIGVKARLQFAIHTAVETSPVESG